MMDCNVIRDLMLLTEGGDACEASRTLVEQHVQACDACRVHQEELRRESAPLPPAALDAPLVKVRRRLRRSRAYTALLWAAVAVLAITTAFAWLTRPTYFSWEDARLGLYAAQGEGETFLAAAPSSGVTRLGLQAYPGVADEPAHLEVTAWTTPLDRLTRRSFAAIALGDQAALPIYYIDCARGGEAVPLDDAEADGGFQALPRLALGYYALFAAGAAAVLALLWLVLRRRPVGRVLLYALAAPLCYLAAHGLVMGPVTVTFDMLRELGLMLLDALALYLIFVSLMRLHRAA